MVVSSYFMNRSSMCVAISRAIASPPGSIDFCVSPNPGLRGVWRVLQQQQKQQRRQRGCENQTEMATFTQTRIGSIPRIHIFQLEPHCESLYQSAPHPSLATAKSVNVQLTSVSSTNCHLPSSQNNTHTIPDTVTRLNRRYF